MSDEELMEQVIGALYPHVSKDGYHDLSYLVGVDIYPEAPIGTDQSDTGGKGPDRLDQLRAVLKLLDEGGYITLAPRVHREPTESTWMSDFADDTRSTVSAKITMKGVERYQDKVAAAATRAQTDDVIAAHKARNRIGFWALCVSILALIVSLIALAKSMGD